MTRVIYLSLIILSIFCCKEGEAQEPVHTFSESFEMVASDPLGHFYLIREGQINKVDSLGKVLYTFSDPGKGNVSWLDASDPFRILVYFRSFNQVLFLDRTLSPLGDPVRLDNLEIFIPAGICRSSQGGFWLVDQTSGSLVHLDSELKYRVNIRLSGIEMDRDEAWFPMLEWKERLYICHPERQVFQFDLFGKHLKNIPAKVMNISSLGNSLLLTGDCQVSQ